MSIRKDNSAKIQPTWILDYFDENGNRRRSRMQCSMNLAKAKYRMILNEIELRKMGLKDGEHFTPLSDLVTQYLISSEIDGKSYLTVRRIKNATDSLIRLLGKDISIHKITPTNIEDFKRSRLTELTPRKTILTKAGLNSEIRHIKAMFNWAVKRQIISVSPLLNIDFAKVIEKPVRFLSNPELKYLFDVIDLSANRRFKDLIMFYLQTGARCRELLPPKFTWENVNFIRRTIILVGKRKRRHTLPLNNILLNILKRRSNEEYPFNFTANQVSHGLSKYYQLAGIKNANVHTLRKSCGAILIQQGVDIYRVSKWLRHSTVVVTEHHYIDLLKSDYEDIIEIMGESNLKEFV